MSNSQKDSHLEALIEIKGMLKDSSSFMVQLDKKLDLHIQKTEYELAAIEKMDVQQNKLLDEHIEGVNTLKKWADDHSKQNEQRFLELAKPQIGWAFIVRTLTVVASLSGGLYYALKVLGVIK